MPIKILKLLLLCMISICGCKSEQDKPLEKQKSPYADLLNFQETAVAGVRDSINVPKISFDHSSYDFGSVIAGEKVEYSYHFHNTGKRDLYILDTKSSCGCTVPEYTKSPIKPGGKGEIKLIFDTTGKKDAQDKKVSIFTNTNPNEYLLTIKGHVISHE